MMIRVLSSVEIFVFFIYLRVAYTKREVHTTSNNHEINDIISFWHKCSKLCSIVAMDIPDTIYEP